MLKQKGDKTTPKTIEKVEDKKTQENTQQNHSNTKITFIVIIKCISLKLYIICKIISRYRSMITFDNQTFILVILTISIGLDIFLNLINVLVYITLDVSIN